VNDQTAYEMAKAWKEKYAPEMTEREVSCMAIGFATGWAAADKAARPEQEATK